MTRAGLTGAARFAWWLSRQGRNLEAVAVWIEARIAGEAEARGVAVDAIYGPLWR
jgi:hypothetical protein